MNSNTKTQCFCAEMNFAHCCIHCVVTGLRVMDVDVTGHVIKARLGAQSVRSPTLHSRTILSRTSSKRPCIRLILHI